MSTVLTILGAYVLWFAVSLVVVVALCRAAAAGDRQARAALDHARQQDAA